MYVEEGQVRVHGGDDAAHTADSVLCGVTARDDDDAAAGGLGEVVACERKVGDALGHAAGIFHVGDHADDFVAAPVAAEMLADGVAAGEEGTGGFLIQDEGQGCAAGCGGCVDVEALIGLVEFTAGEDGFVDHGKEAGAYGLFVYAFLYRGGGVRIVDGELEIVIVAGQIGRLDRESEAGDGRGTAQAIGETLKDGLGFLRGIAVAHRIDEEEGHGPGVEVGLDAVALQDAEDEESCDEQEKE